MCLRRWSIPCNSTRSSQHSGRGSRELGSRGPMNSETGFSDFRGFRTDTVPWLLYFCWIFLCHSGNVKEHMVGTQWFFGSTLQCLDKLILYRVLLQAIAIAREDEHQMVSRDDRVLTRPYQHDKEMYMDATSCFANLGRKLLKELLALLLDCMVSELQAVQQCMLPWVWA